MRHKYKHGFSHELPNTMHPGSHEIPPICGQLKRFNVNIGRAVERGVPREPMTYRSQCDAGMRKDFTLTLNDFATVGSGRVMLG